MTDVNFKLYQQMVNKGIIEQYQKENPKGKEIDTEEEKKSLKKVITENFDANNDGEVNDADIEEMRKTYNQMVNYLADVNKNAAGIKIVDLTTGTPDITSRTKMFFDAEGNLQWYQDGYSYYKDGDLKGKEKGYTQHILTNGTKKVVDNFEYNDFYQAIKWEENIFANETTKDSIQQKQEITWASDGINADTRTIQNINKETGEVDGIKAYKLNDNGGAPNAKTSTEVKSVSSSEITAIKDSFLKDWTGVSDDFKNTALNFEYKINFGDLTQSAKVSEFQKNDLEYKILRDSDNNAVAAISSNNDTTRVYQLTSESTEEFLEKLDDFANKLDDNVNIFKNNYTFDEYQKNGNEINLKAALKDGESEQTLMDTWVLGTNYADIADNFTYNENNKVTSFKILNKMYNVLYNDQGQQVAIVADSTDTNTVYQLQDDGNQEEIKNVLENSGYSLKDNVKVYDTDTAIDGTNYINTKNRLTEENPSVNIPDLELPTLEIPTLEIPSIEVPDKPTVPAIATPKVAASTEDTTKCLEILKGLTNALPTENITIYNVQKNGSGNIIAFDYENSDDNFIDELQSTNKERPSEYACIRNEIRVFDIKYNNNIVSEFSVEAKQINNSGEEYTTLYIEDLENNRIFSYYENDIGITETKYDDLNRTTESCYYTISGNNTTQVSKTTYKYIGNSNNVAESVSISNSMYSGYEYKGKSITTYKYDSSNNILESDTISNSVYNDNEPSKTRSIVSYKYEANTNKLSETETITNSTSDTTNYKTIRTNKFTYDNEGYLISENDKENTQSNYAGKLTTRKTDDTYAYTYENGIIKTKEITDEDGKVEKYTYEYDAKGKITKETVLRPSDSYTIVHTYNEDAMTLKQVVETHKNQTITTDYNVNGKITKETSVGLKDYNNYTNTYTYDEDGITLKQKTETNNYNTVTTDYNSNGKITKETSVATNEAYANYDYYNYTKTYTYFENGTIKKETEAYLNYTTTIEYNSNGTIAKETSVTTNETYADYDYYNYTNTYTYHDDNITVKQKLETFNDYTITTDYNSKGEITKKVSTSESYPYTKIYTYQEDNTTLQKAVETYNDYTLTTDYNSKGEVTQETSVGTSEYYTDSDYYNYTKVYTYQEDNTTLKKAVETYNNYTVTTDYNTKGNVTKSVSTNEYNPYTKVYTYQDDEITLQKSIETYTNRTITTDYNANGQMTQLVSTGTNNYYNYTTTCEYDTNGNILLKKTLYSNESYFDENTKTEYIYDSDGNLIKTFTYSYSDMLIEELAQYQYNVEHNIDVTNSQTKINEILTSGKVKINGEVITSIDEIKNAYQNLVTYINENKDAIAYLKDQTNLDSSIEEFLSILKDYLKNNSDKLNLGTTPEMYYNGLVYGMRDFYGYGNPGRTESLENILNNTMFPANLRQAAGNILSIDKKLKENPVIANLLTYDSYSNENSVLIYNRTTYKLELNAINEQIKTLESKTSRTDEENAQLTELKKEYIQKEADYKAIYEKNIQSILETMDIEPLTTDKSGWHINEATATYLDVKNKSEITTTPAISGSKELTSAAFVKDTTITPSLTTAQLLALYNSDTVSNSELEDDFFVAAWREMTPAQRSALVTIDGDSITVNLAGVINYDVATTRTYKISDLEQITGINLNYKNGTKTESTIKALCSDNILMKAVEMAIIDNHGAEVFNDDYYYGSVYTYMTTVRTTEKTGTYADWNKAVGFIKDNVTYVIADYDYTNVTYYNPNSPTNTVTTPVSGLRKAEIRVIQTLGDNEFDNDDNYYSPEYYDDDGRYDMRYFNWCSPLAFDKNANGIKTTSEIVNFDIDGDGIIDKVNNSEDLVLAFDADGDGIIGEDGKELFGNNTDLDGDGKADGYANGFEALKALAVKYGLISVNDSVLDADDLKYLQDTVGLRLKNGYLGESFTFDELGITQINLPTTSATQLQQNFDGKNNDLMTQKGATFIMNGEVRTYADIWHKKK